MELFYQWDEKCLAIGELSTSSFENSCDKGNPEFLKTKSIKNVHMLWKYLHHLVREAQESSIPGNSLSILLPDQFCSLTWNKVMTWRLQDSNQNTSSVSNTRYQGQPKQDSRHECNQNADQLLAFKKSIKREASQYTILKDETHFEAFKRNLLVTATTHGCEEILEGDYVPGYAGDCQELFQQKQYFMYSLFNKVLQSDMGKTIVRKYAPALDAQSVWKDLETTSSKGLNESHRLHAYVSTTIYGRSWKGTTA